MLLYGSIDQWPYFKAVLNRQNCPAHRLVAWSPKARAILGPRRLNFHIPFLSLFLQYSKHALVLVAMSLDSMSVPLIPSAMQSPEAWLALGEQLMGQRRYDDATKALATAMQQHPDDLRIRNRYWPLDPLWGATLTAQRIRLRPWSSADETFLLLCFNTVEFMQSYHRFAAPARKPEVLRRHLANARFPVVNHRAVHWIVEHFTSAGDKVKDWQPIGLADLTEINLNHARAELIFGLLDPASRGQAYAITSMVLLLEHAFNRMRLHKLTSVVYGDNTLAQRNTRTLGFIQEGIRREHLRDPQTGAWLDTFENGLLATSYRSDPRIQFHARRLLGQGNAEPFAARLPSLQQA